MTSKEIKVAGWYWMRYPTRPQEDPTIKHIRKYQRQWCISNWQIPDDAEYEGPIERPPGW